MKRAQQITLIVSALLGSWLAMQAVHETAPIGLLLWHRQGPHFGLGIARGQVSSRAAYATLILLVTLIVVEFALGLE